MTWLDRLGAFLAGPDEGNAIENAQPPVDSVLEAETLAEEDRYWRSVSAAGVLEPPWAVIQQQQLDATEAYRVNPLAFRIVELTADHVIGKGIKLQAKDKRLQKWLDLWWHHPLNRMPLRVYDLCRELSITGELFLTFHPDPFTGLVFLRQIPPTNVDEVETDPEDLEAELRFHESGTTEPGGRWWATDRAAHYAVNRLAGCVRGQSDLAPALPWLRRYKDWLTDRVRINRFKGAFLWWVKLTGADRATVEQKRTELMVPPASGSIIVTNDSEEWTAVQPNIDSQAVEADGRAIRMMLAAGAGVPLHFLAEPEQTSRATAAEMQGPTLRHFENRQQTFGWVLADAARRCALLSGKFHGDLSIVPIFQDLTTVDNLAVAQAAGAMVTALAVARDRDWITDATAKATLNAYIGLKQETE